jgi:7,8-dihydropterin-6-yl-methyl-4-(beta-D-ribofuranosyl)aminobenzene 5'-phosphate synthase
MNVKIVNIFNNICLPKTQLKGKHGNAFYLEFDNEKILFDTGSRGDILLHNMKLLRISPNDINIIVFSHGHDDHTLGLESFLIAREKKEKVAIIAHPNVKEPKFLNFLKWRISYIGFPKLNTSLESKIDYIFKKDSYQINPYLFTTGEIIERPYMDGTAKYMVHKEAGKWIKDPLLDDISLVLKTKNGLVLICGCCHAGLLNTCEHVSSMYNERILAILGGTHMILFSKKKLREVANILKEKYDTPLLYLNHCTGYKKIKLLRELLGFEIVKPCLAGTELQFSC